MNKSTTLTRFINYISGFESTTELLSPIDFQEFLFKKTQSILSGCHALINAVIRKFPVLIFIAAFAIFSLPANAEIKAENKVPEISEATSIQTCSITPQATNQISGIGDYFTNLFVTDYWPARWTCGVWNEGEGWMYIASDLSIFFSYLSIPLMLLWYIRNKRLGKLMWIVGLFAAFILLCGFTHLVDAIMFWNPVYRFSGFMKLLTGVVSLSTAGVLSYIIPIGLRFKSPKELQEENDERKRLQNIFDLFLKYSPGAIAMFDREMRYLMVNENWYSDFNLADRNIIGKSHYDLFPEILEMEDRLDDHNRTLEGESIRRERETLIINDKKEIYNIELVPWYHPDGSIGGIIKFIEAITEKEVLKENLSSAEKRAESQNEVISELSKVARIGTWQLFPDEEHFYWSDIMYYLHGVDQDIKIDMDTFQAFIHPEHRAEISLLINKALQYGRPFDTDCKITTQQGKELWVRAIGQPVLNKDNKVIMVKGMYQDIHKIKSSEELLENNNKLLEKEVSKRTQELSLTIEDLKNTQHQLVENEKLASLGQLSAGIAHEINTPLGAINASVGSLQNSFWKSLELLRELQQIIGKRETELLFSLLQESNTAKERLSTREERALRRQIMKELSDWEINNSVQLADKLVDMNIRNDISLYKDLIKHDRSDQLMSLAYHLTNEAKAAKNIELAVQKAGKTVFALKSYTRFEDEEHPEKIDICENLETVLILYQNQLKQGIHITKYFPHDPVEIVCYPDRLIQVWTNLIHNAMQAMDNKGHLTIKVNKLSANKVEVRIKDTGPGISPEHQSKIFNTFFTTKAKGEGSGLGLDIVRKIINKHHAEITFNSDENGTEFIVTLPVSVEVPVN